MNANQNHEEAHKELVQIKTENENYALEIKEADLHLSQLKSAVEVKSAICETMSEELKQLKTELLQMSDIDKLNKDRYFSSNVLYNTRNHIVWVLLNTK